MWLALIWKFRGKWKNTVCVCLCGGRGVAGAHTGEDADQRTIQEGVTLELAFACAAWNKDNAV